MMTAAMIIIGVFAFGFAAAIAITVWRLLAMWRAADEERAGGKF